MNCQAAVTDRLSQAVACWLHKLRPQRGLISCNTERRIIRQAKAAAAVAALVPHDGGVHNDNNGLFLQEGHPIVKDRYEDLPEDDAELKHALAAFTALQDAAAFHRVFPTTTTTLPPIMARIRKPHSLIDNMLASFKNSPLRSSCINFHLTFLRSSPAPAAAASRLFSQCRRPHQSGSSNCPLH